MNTALAVLVERLDNPALEESNVIPWGCPVPAFGDISRSRVATLGLNPSNREFVDIEGRELDGESRRFHTLNSLGLNRWSEATTPHIRLIAESCRAYFCRNPYDLWFKKLDSLISGTQASYYDSDRAACHLDLIPYATACKWTGLTRQQRSALLAVAGDTLALLLQDSPVEVLILNGNSVVELFQEIAGIRLEKHMMLEWSLPRRSEPSVPGFAYKGSMQSLSGIELRRKIIVLGFNHNIQSSFGVTTQVCNSIRRWITHTVSEVVHEH